MTASLALSGNAQQFPDTMFQKAGEEYRLTVGELPWHYFGFQHSTDLQRFSTIGMALGVPAPTFSHVPAAGETRGFFRAENISRLRAKCRQLIRDQIAATLDEPHRRTSTPG